MMDPRIPGLLRPVGDHARSAGKVSGEKVNSLLIVADLRGPEIPNLSGVLKRTCHPPTTDPELPVGKRHSR
jgi:hypothetical protein